MGRMSMLPTVNALEHHTLEVLVFQWDGSAEKARAIAFDLKHELPMRGAEVREIHHRVKQSLEEGFHGNELMMRIERRSDGHEWNVTLNHGQFCALWLHNDLVYMVTTMNEGEAAVFFRRVNPVIRLSEHREVTE